jgi:DNA repair exonuclease SbcCD nuclease subunit
VLNTREQVSVRALSSALTFFDRMAERLQVPIHILLGNHDMNLKHSSKVSSLDALATNSMHKGGSFHLYRDITPTNVAGIPALMVPYHEDVSAISDAIENLQSSVNLRDCVVFGHLAVNGAIQNSSSSFRYQGALPSHVFRSVRRTFSGHFHVHQTLPNSTLRICMSF